MFLIGTKWGNQIEPRSNFVYKYNNKTLGESNIRPVKIKNGKVYESLSEICSGHYCYCGQDGFIKNRSGAVGSFQSAGDSLYVTQFTSLSIWPAGQDGQDISYGANYGVPNIGWIDYFGYMPDRDNPKFGDCGIDNNGNLWLGHLELGYNDYNTYTYEKPGISFYMKMKTNIPLDGIKFYFNVTGNTTIGSNSVFLEIKQIGGYYGIRLTDNRMTGPNSPINFELTNSTNTLTTLDLTQTHSYFFKVSDNKASIYIDFVKIGEVSFNYTNVVSSYNGYAGMMINVLNQDTTKGFCMEQIGYFCDNIPTIEQLKKIANYN